MSTKMYSGVRFRLSRLGEFVEYVRIKGLARVEAEARALLEAIPEQKLAPDEARLDEERRAKLLRCRRVRKLIDAVREAAKNPSRSELDLHRGWNLWVAQDGRHVLGSPWGSWPDRAARPRWAEEYGYWNNSERPERLTARQWRKRKVDWEVACAPSHQNHKFVVYVFDAATASNTLDLCWLQLRLEGHAGDGKRPFGRPGTVKDYARACRKIEARVGR